MLFDRIDFGKLKGDIAELVAACTEAKRLLRTTWVRPMAEEQRRLCRHRRRVTELLVLLARSRGSLHVIAAPRAVRDAGCAWDALAYNQRIAERVALDYVVEGPGRATTP